MTVVEHMSAAWFGTEAVSIGQFANAGFSGSRVFLVRGTSGERFVLKSFAPGTPVARAAWVHALMRHLRATGLTTVPGVACLPPPDANVHHPASARWQAGHTLAPDGQGTLWELVDFLPGAASQAPTEAEAAAALTGLGRLHIGAATMPGSTPRVEPSTGVARRATQAQRMQEVSWRERAASAAAQDSAEVRSLLQRAIRIVETPSGQAALDTVAATPAIPLPVQAVLRDVWSEHVLFTADGQLAGFIDFHAAGCDTPATDLARLLGSWDMPGADPCLPLSETWAQALAAYDAERPLAAHDRHLIDWLHATGVVCGLDNWFRWLIDERRTFEDIRRVAARLARLVHQLPAALERARHPFPGRD